jgi:hypothetical protein|tara:strand:+ start:720 stop:890 length:171 start_codon:yes stop_codon:yes gene_type:complete
MKVGDIVKFRKMWIIATGLIIETGVYTGRRDVKVMWEDGEIFTENSKSLEVINENR